MVINYFFWVIDPGLVLYFPWIHFEIAFLLENHKKTVTVLLSVEKQYFCVAFLNPPRFLFIFVL